MKEYAFHFLRKENAPEQQKNCMVMNNWADIEQAKSSAQMYLGMMRSDYKRVSIYVKRNNMWVDSGVFVDETDLV